MDCVTCEKCRLWGKLQISGIGTALKILFSYGSDPKEFRLARSELVALINGLNRLSTSITSLNLFMQEERKLSDIERRSNPVIEEAFSQKEPPNPSTKTWEQFYTQILTYTMGIVLVLLILTE
jgi:hypothetical protein